MKTKARAESSNIEDARSWSNISARSSQAVGRAHWTYADVQKLEPNIDDFPATADGAAAYNAAFNNYYDAKQGWLAEQHAISLGNLKASPSTVQDFSGNASANQPGLSQPQIGSGAVRNRALSPKLAALLDSVGKEVGVYIVVGSGGQSSDHSSSTYKKSGGWTGSHRHDEGNAADVKAYRINPDGSMGPPLDFNNPEDQQVWSNIVKLSVAGGATGIGAGNNYMGGQTVHIGYGKPAYWGDGESAAGAPQWLKTAYADGQHLPPMNIPTVASELDVTPPAGMASLQRQLADRGFDPGPIDGVKGPRTTAAVKAFQRANGLKEDGIVGPKTQAALAAAGVPMPRPRPEPPVIMHAPPASPGEPAYGRGTLGKMRRAADNALSTLGPAPAQHAVGPTPELQTLPPPPIAQLQPEFDHSNIKVISVNPDGTPVALGPAPTNSLATLGDIHDARDSAAMAAQRGSVAPIPMSRPVVTATAPTPMPRPIVASAPAAAPPQRQKADQSVGSSPPAKQMVTLPSGKQVAVGTYHNKDGSISVVTAGPNGEGIVTQQRSGFDLASEATKPTVLGGIIRSKIPQALGDAASSAGNALGEAAGNAQQAVVDAASGVKNNVLGFAGNAFTSLGNTLGFGGSPAPATSSSTLADIHDRREGGTVTAMRSAAPVAPAPMQRPVVATSRPAPQQRQRQQGGGQQQSAPQTFKGTSTGRTYTVGQQYSNGNGTFVANSNGTFTKVA